jgi:hypothetical protein
MTPTHKPEDGDRAPISMKPRIKKNGFCEYRARVWTCVGGGGFGQGETPLSAFLAWQRFVKFYGVDW